MRAVASLALLKSSWDKNRTTYLDGFIPFIATLVDELNYQTLSNDEIDSFCKEFEKTFQLSIPFHPMMAILNKSRKMGLFRKELNHLIPVKEKIAGLVFSKLANEKESEFNQVLTEYIAFCHDKYNREVTSEEAEQVFIGYLKEHDLDILFASDQRSVLPEVKKSKEWKYLINNFIKFLYEEESDLFAYIVNIAIGHIIASSILYTDLEKYEGKLQNCKVYLDTRIIFYFLGMQGGIRKEASINLINTIQEQGGQICVFQHTIDEINGILDNCYRWIEKGGYDLSKANAALVYFVDEGYSPSDVLEFIGNIPQLLGLNEIKIDQAPDPNIDKQHQIDESKLKEYILDAYNIYDIKDELAIQYTIEKDIKSISAIYKLRGNNKPRRITETSQVLITTNSSLAYADRLFENDELEAFCIPACLTDIFFGTIIWMQSPSKMENLNYKRIIADSYAAVRPNKELISKLIDQSQELYNRKEITKDEYLLLRTDVTTRELLAEKTLGDPDNFNDQTAKEIVEEYKVQIQRKVKRETEKAYASITSEKDQRILEEIKVHGETKGQLETEQQRAYKHKEKITKRSNQWANFISYALFLPTVAVISVCGYFTFFGNIQNTILLLLLAITSLVFFIISLIFGFNARSSLVVTSVLSSRYSSFVISFRLYSSCD